MNGFTHVTWAPWTGTLAASWWLDAALKSFIVLTVSGAGCLLLRRGPAAARHFLWLLGLAGAACLPALSLALPIWHNPVWAFRPVVDSGNRYALALELRVPAINPAETVTTGTFAGGLESQATSRRSARIGPDTMSAVLGLWVAGSGLVLGTLVAGWVRVGRLGRGATLLADTSWVTELEKARHVLRLRRSVRLLQGPAKTMPATWGWFRPAILLPEEAQHWPAERRRMVLLHELAHIKRWDCLTQSAARLVCALYWFNPLAWIATRRMGVERERACDDRVVRGGWKASDYAAELVEIARSFRCVRAGESIAMARSSGLTRRIAAILDASRPRRLSASGLLALTLPFALITLLLAAEDAGTTKSTEAESTPRKPWFDARLRAFFEAKDRHARYLADLENKPKLAPEIWPFFDAGRKGDWLTASNLWVAMRHRAHQYENTVHDDTLDTVVWSPILEVDLAWEEFANMSEKYVLDYGNGIVRSIPAGSIYFGGTDPGRGLPTAMCRSHQDADPFFTLTQNALADGLYAQYLRLTYGSKIRLLETNDLETAFEEYMADAGRRLAEGKLKPGENVKTNTTGGVNVSGQVAVMSINGLLVRMIFERNPDREFYIEESFPLDWMYPYLRPHGYIMKLNRRPIGEMTADVVREDEDFWGARLKSMIGDWLHEGTSVGEVAAFAERTYLDHNLSGFHGDPVFVGDTWAQRTYSKLRSSQAGVYVWRAEHASTAGERARMEGAADLAFRQSLALCPYSPEAVFRYADFLRKGNRTADAILVVKTALKFESQPGAEFNAASLRSLLGQLELPSQSN